MAIYSSWTFTSLLCAALSILQCVISSSAASPALGSHATTTANDLFDGICKGIRDPPLCFETIRSIPEAARARSLESLVQISIDFGRSNYVHSLVPAAKSPRLKENYKSCAKNYANAISNLEDAQRNLTGHDYTGVGVKVTAGMSLVEGCKDNFKHPPTQDPSELPGKNKHFNMLVLYCIISLSDSKI